LLRLINPCQRAIRKPSSLSSASTSRECMIGSSSLERESRRSLPRHPNHPPLTLSHHCNAACRENNGSGCCSRRILLWTDLFSYRWPQFKRRSGLPRLTYSVEEAGGCRLLLIRAMPPEYSKPKISQGRAGAMERLTSTRTEFRSSIPGVGPTFIKLLCAPRMN
jgi:hypothetical protein